MLQHEGMPLSMVMDGLKDQTLESFAIDLLMPNAISDRMSDTLHGRMSLKKRQKSIRKTLEMRFSIQECPDSSRMTSRS